MQSSQLAPERPAASVTLEHLVSVVERDPGAAVVLLLAQRPSSSARQWFQLAGQLCQALRQRGRYELVLKLASATGRCTLRLRLEEALCACLQGRYDLARSLVGRDRRVGAIVQPVLDALSGGHVRLPSGAKSRATKDLQSGAKALGELSRGRLSSAVAAARATNDPMFEHAVRTAAELSRDGERRHMLLRDYLESDDVAAQPKLGSAIIEQAKGEDLLQLNGLRLASRIPERVWSQLIQAQLRYAADDPLRLSTLLRAVDSRHVAEGWLGHHYLWRGYQEVRRRPKGALEALTHAVNAKGHDLETILVEALRGRYLVALRQLERLGPSLDNADQLIRSGERLYGALIERDAKLEAAVLAQHTACVLLGEVRAFCETSRVHDWVKRARALREHLGADAMQASDELSCAEASAALASDPERTLALVESILEHDARHGDAWRLRLLAARRLDDPRLGDWAAEAYRRTGEPGFSRLVERVQLERGELKLFERLRDDPELSPGKLLVECLRYLLAQPDQAALESWSRAWQLSRPLLSQLDAARSSAVDAGLLGFGLTRFGIEACAKLMCTSLIEHSEVHEASLVVGALLHSEQFIEQSPGDLVETSARALLRQPRGSDALPVFMAALAHLGEHERARRVLLRTAATLPSSALRCCQKSCELPAGCEGGFDSLHDHLHPELCAHGLFDPGVELRSLLNSADGDLEADDALGDHDAVELRELDAEIEELGWLTKLFKIDVAKLRALEPERKAAFLDSLYTVDSPQTPGSLAAARKLVDRFGVSKDGMGLPGAFKPSNSTEKNKRKRQRKQQRKRGK